MSLHPVWASLLLLLMVVIFFTARIAPEGFFHRSNTDTQIWAAVFGFIMILALLFELRG